MNDTEQNNNFSAYKLKLLTTHEGFSIYIKHTARGHNPRVVLLILYQLNPKGAVNNWLLARLRTRLNVCYMSAVCICECSCVSTVAIVVKLAYSY